MAKIILLPLEQFEERYTTQWYKWFTSELSESDCFSDLIVVNPDPMTTEIEEGQFLDVLGTNHYKAAQLETVLEMIHADMIADGDIILVMDYWFPGIEMLAYARDGLQLDFKIAGCLHAGTWDEHDFLSQQEMGTWARSIEEGWFVIADLLFVATEFHKELICKRRVVDRAKIKVTGFPIWENGFEESVSEPLTREKLSQKIVVFPHRLAPEKNPDAFVEMMEANNRERKFPNAQFIRTKDIASTKDEYYGILFSSLFSVSFAKQETWGIAMQESVLCGCIPIVPDRLSYSEMYLDVFKYPSKSEDASIYEGVTAYKRMIKLLNMDRSDLAVCWSTQRFLILNSGRNAIQNMIRHLVKL